MGMCLEIIYLFLGLPIATTFYKKFLVAKSSILLSNSNIENIKEGGSLNIKNLEAFDVADTYLSSKAEEKVTIRGQTDSCMYTHSKIFKEKNEWIEKKRQISAKECMKLLENADKSLRVLKKKRVCFLYNKRYFCEHICYSYMVIDTYTEIDGSPSILRVLHEKGRKEPVIPSFLKIIREITDEKEYGNYLMARPDWVMPEKDKTLIEEVEKEESTNGKNDKH